MQASSKFYNYHLKFSLASPNPTYTMACMILMQIPDIIILFHLYFSISKRSGL